MKKLTKDSPAEEKLQACKAAIAALMSTLERGPVDKDHPAVKYSFPSIMNDKWEEFVVFDTEEDKKKADELRGKLTDLIDLLEKTPTKETKATLEQMNALLKSKRKWV